EGADLKHGLRAGRLRRLGRGEQVAAIAHQRTRIVEAHLTEPAALALVGRHRAVYGDLRVRLVGAELDRAAIAEHGMPTLRDQLALGVDGEGAGAGVALATRGLDHEVVVAAQRHVQRIARALERTLAQVDR